MTTKERAALDAIHAILDGEEWNSDTTVKVAEVIQDYGYIITDPNITDENDPKPPLPPLPAETVGKFSSEHMEAAACMWEHVLQRIRRVKPGDVNPWDEYREAYGMAALREVVIFHAPELELAYVQAVANGYDKAFDWEYVPKYMEDHVARILA